MNTAGRSFVRRGYWAQQARWSRAPSPEQPLASAIDVSPPAQLAEVTQTRTLVLPPLQAVSAAPQEDEGAWTSEGLPNPAGGPPLIAETRFHPRTSLPTAAVHVLLFDTSRVRLNMVGGTRSPGGDLGVVGPGRLPHSELPALVAAWNGGFQGAHAPDYGMYADGQEYRPLSDGLATIVVTRDARVTIGQWGRDITKRTEDMVAVRQNSVLIVDDGAISSQIGEGVVFGLVNVGDTMHFITWRSAIGLTADGNLLVATGDYVNQEHMAQCMQAAGTRYAMLLDNNFPYVQTVLAERTGSQMRLRNTRDFMKASPDRCVSGPYLYDLMYLTLAD